MLMDVTMEFILV
jgi:hypothetical protein